MKIFFFIIHLFFQQTFSTILVNRINIEVDVNQECRILKKPITMKVFFGWPISIPCERVRSRLEDERNDGFYLDYEGIATQRPVIDRERDSLIEDATCVIWDVDHNQEILNETVDFPNSFSNLAFNIINFNHNDSLNYLIKAWFTGKENSCIGAHVKLNVSTLPELSCEESIKNSQLTERRGRLDNTLLLACTAPLSKNAPLHKIVNYSVTWFKNCEYLPEKPIISGEWSGALNINRLTFEHPGVYSCEVTHNGMRRYVSHYRMCVLTGKSRVQDKIHCTKTIYHTTIGSKLVVECEGNHEYFPDHFHFHIVWQKSSSSTQRLNCSNHIKNIQRKAWHSNATCSFHFDDICFHEIPSKKEIEKAGKAVLMRLTFNNIKQADFGNYTITVSNQQHHIAQAHFIIQNTNIPNLMDTATAVGITAVVLLCWFVTSIVLFHFKFIYLKWRWRQIFGPLQPDDKMYGAYLSYHFSTSMDKFAKEQTRDAVSAVREELISLGHSMYDELKDGIYIEMRAENAIEYMKKCHRVIIILNSEFLRDHWDFFVLEKGFEEMIQCDCKLIFILLPGMKEYIEQHSPHDDKIRLVQSAIKSNCAIEWTNSKHFNSKKFSMLLELAMPKLRSRLKSLRRTSTSSSLGSQLAVLYKKPFRRTMSNETGTTELGSPTSTDSNSAEFDVETERNR